LYVKKRRKKKGEKDREKKRGVGENGQIKRIKKKIPFGITGTHQRNRNGGGRNKIGSATGFKTVNKSEEAEINCEKR